MEIIDINTEKISEDSKDMLLLISEIKEIFDDTFDTLYNMVDKNNIWLGYSADMFKNDVLIDKQNYIHFRESLNKYSNFLSDYQLEMSKMIGALKK